MVIQTATPPEAAPLGSVAASQGEAAAAEGDPGAGTSADAESTSGEHRGTADGTMATLTILTNATETGRTLG